MADNTIDPNMRTPSANQITHEDFIERPQTHLLSSQSEHIHPSISQTPSYGQPTKFLYQEAFNGAILATTPQPMNGKKLQFSSSAGGVQGNNGQEQLSVLELDIFETKRQVSSPLSLKACQIEGILPKDLLYRPVEHYMKSCKDPSMAELKYRIHEAKRHKHLELVKDTRMRLLHSQKYKQNYLNIYSQQQQNSSNLQVSQSQPQLFARPQQSPSSPASIYNNQKNLKIFKKALGAGGFNQANRSIQSGNAGLIPSRPFSSQMIGGQQRSVSNSAKVNEIYFNSKYMKPIPPFFQPIDSKLQLSNKKQTTPNQAQLQQSGQNSPIVQSRYLSSRFSTRASLTSARRFVRKHPKSEQIVDNALLSHNQALESKITSVQEDFSRELEMFKAVVKAQNQREERNKGFRFQLDSYQLMKESLERQLERSLKLKSDQIIQQRIERELSSQRLMQEEKEKFKQEQQVREELQFTQEVTVKHKLQRMNSAKVLNHAKRFEVYKRAEEDLHDNLSNYKSKMENKEKRYLDQDRKLKMERKEWKQRLREMLRKKQDEAKERLEKIHEEFYSEPVADNHLVRLYQDIEEKHVRHQIKQRSIMMRLKSANLSKEEKVKQTYKQWEQQIASKSQHLAALEEQKKGYIQQIAKQKEKQVQQSSNLYQVKRQIAKQNKEQSERQKDYEASELTMKIQDHQQAHSTFSELKSNIENKRLKFQFDLERRKNEIRETLFSMNVWNVWDEGVLDQVFNRPTGTSIDHVVRQFAKDLQLKQRKLNGNSEEAKNENIFQGGRGNSTNKFFSSAEDFNYSPSPPRTLNPSEYSKLYSSYKTPSIQKIGKQYLPQPLHKSTTPGQSPNPASKKIVKLKAQQVSKNNVMPKEGDQGSQRGSGRVANAVIIKGANQKGVSGKLQGTSKKNTPQKQNFMNGDQDQETGQLKIPLQSDSRQQSSEKKNRQEGVQARDSVLNRRQSDRNTHSQNQSLDMPSPIVANNYRSSQIKPSNLGSKIEQMGANLYYQEDFEQKMQQPIYATKNIDAISGNQIPQFKNPNYQTNNAESSSMIGSNQNNQLHQQKIPNLRPLPTYKEIEGNVREEDSYSQDEDHSNQQQDEQQYTQGLSPAKSIKSNGSVKQKPQINDEIREIQHQQEDEAEEYEEEGYAEEHVQQEEQINQDQEQAETQEEVEDEYAQDQEEIDDEEELNQDKIQGQQNRGIENKNTLLEEPANFEQDDVQVENRTQTNENQEESYDPYIEDENFQQIQSSSLKETLPLANQPQLNDVKSLQPSNQNQSQNLQQSTLTSQTRQHQMEGQIIHAADDHHQENGHLREHPNYQEQNSDNEYDEIERPSIKVNSVTAEQQAAILMSSGSVESRHSEYQSAVKNSKVTEEKQQSLRIGEDEVQRRISLDDEPYEASLKSPDHQNILIENSKGIKNIYQPQPLEESMNFEIEKQNSYSHPEDEVEEAIPQQTLSPIAYQSAKYQSNQEEEEYEYDEDQDNYEF